MFETDITHEQYAVFIRLYADSEGMDDQQPQSGTTSAKKDGKGSVQTEKMVAISDEEFSK